MSEADVLRVIVTLVFILMVILAGAWAVRRSGLGRSGGGNQTLRLLASHSLGNRAWVAIVEVEDARLVLGVTSQQINLLHTLPPGATETDPTTGPSSPSPGFTAALARALKRR
ncbi:flagellar biosynthetic protein FliO [Achromobacter sp. F4_2707]|uniref:flagellar biosynthetic protein FliO n=1 Tax=Achromobacter sp. F4_2707 TaxID=3114286 RepID=UPI0039C6A79D